MKLEEFLKCEHDIDMNTSMTRLYCLKCGQDANVIDYVKMLQEVSGQMKEMISHLESFTGIHISRCNEGFSFSGHELCDELTEKTNSIKKLQKENETLRKCVEFYSIEACNEDWCERYLPEQDRGIIDYLSGKLAKKCLAKLGER